MGDQDVIVMHKREPMSKAENFGGIILPYKTWEQQLKTREQRHKQDEVDRQQDFSKDENEERGNWSGRLDFLLACLGYAVGLGNVWRFPYLCYRNGGAIFFIPYVIMLFFVGMPIFFLELSLGQFTSSGPLTCWKFAPMFTGLGVAMNIVSAIVAIYYNIIIGWSIYYFVASFFKIPDLPWHGEGACDNEYNTPYCLDRLKNEAAKSNCTLLGLQKNANGVCYNGTVPFGIWNSTLAKNSSIQAQSPSEEYLYGKVWRLYESDGMHDLGELHWDVSLCLLAAWIIVCLSLIKGIKSSGKVVYFTALFPYVVLIILLIRGVTLSGAQEGIDFYIAKVDIEKLYDAGVWKDAAVQIFFSLSASWGGLIALASYNRFHNNCLRDSLIVSIGNCMTSFFAGFVIFSYLGHLAKELNVSVKDVADGGIGLAFVVYPRAVATLEGSPAWSILFFLMLITLGLDSEFALVETVTTSIMDVFPNSRKKKWAVTLSVSIIFFLLGLTMCTDGGAFMLQLLDEYSGGWNVLLIAFFECLSLCYVYGFRRFKEDIRCMIGDFPCMPWDCSYYWWAFTWCFTTPVLVAIVMVYSFINYKPLKFGEYEYPDWALAIGFLMTAAVVVGMIAPCIYFYIVAEGGPFERLAQIASPTYDWGPSLPKHRRLCQRYAPDFIVDPHHKEGLQVENGLPSEFKLENSHGMTNPGYHHDDEDKTRF